MDDRGEVDHAVDACHHGAQRREVRDVALEALRAVDGLVYLEIEHADLVSVIEEPTDRWSSDGPHTAGN